MSVKSSGERGAVLSVNSFKLVEVDAAQWDQRQWQETSLAQWAQQHDGIDPIPPEDLPTYYYD